MSHPWGQLSLLHLLLLALALRLRLHLFVDRQGHLWWRCGPLKLRPHQLLIGLGGGGAWVVVMDGPEGDGGRAAVFLEAVQVPADRK